MSIETIIQGLLAGAIGGFLANFGAQFGWKYYQRPVIKFGEISNDIAGIELSDDIQVPDGETLTLEPGEAELSRIQYVFYQGQVKNTGRTAAKNCECRVKLQGEQDTDEEIVKYRVEFRGIWSDSESNIATINPEETVSFELFRIKEDGNWVQFPSPNGWEDVTMISVIHESGETNPVHGFDPGALTETDWNIASIEVTGENVKRIESSLEFSIEENLEVSLT